MPSSKVINGEFDSSPGFPTGWIKYAVGLVLLLLALILFLPCTVVGPGSRGVLMNFGAVQPGVLEPGLHLVLPIMQSVEKMDVRVQKYEAVEESSSRDLQDVHTKIAVNYHITPADANWIFQNIGDLQQVNEKVVQPSIDNATKAVTAHYDAEDLVGKRDQVALETFNLLKSALGNSKIIVDAVNITNFSFSPEFSQAIEKKQVAQQQALQAKFDLDKATVASQQTVVTAQANAKAAIETAKGDAESTVLRAKATADSNDLINATLSENIIRLRTLDRWNGILPTYMGGNMPLPFISAEGK